MTQNRVIEVKQLGLIDYKAALAIQEKYYTVILDRKKNSATNPAVRTPNYLLLCEHTPVYTLGSNGSIKQLLTDTSNLRRQAIALYKTNRGGAITYHGPGQLIAYPIIDLENFFTDIHRYLRLLEEAVIEMLTYFNIIATRLPGLTGVWLQSENAQANYERKICAIGIRVSRWVTMHGLALNVNNDLTNFKQIIPCGIDKPVTSMQQELQEAISIKEVLPILEKIILDKLRHS